MDLDLLDDVFDLPATGDDMNPDLAAWAREHPDEQLEATNRRPVAGPCGLCGHPARTRCLRCERPVCVRHHHVMVGICTHCTERQEATPEEDAHEPASDDPFADERPPPRAELDIDWIE